MSRLVELEEPIIELQSSHDNQDALPYPEEILSDSRIFSEVVFGCRRLILAVN